MPSRHRRGTLASGRAVMNSPKDRAKVGAIPVGLRTPQPAPEAACLRVPGAACGNVGPRSAPARAVPAAATDGVRGNPSRVAVRGGIAGSVVGTAGPVQSSSSEPAPLGSGGDRGTESPPLAPSRIAPVVRPPGGRGPHTSPLVAEGRAGGDEGGGPARSTRTTGAGSPPVTDPGGGAMSKGALPPDSKPLSGEDFRKAWKAAESAKNAAARRRRGHRASAPASPGVGRLRVAAPRSGTVDTPPPPTIRVKPRTDPPEAA